MLPRSVLLGAAFVVVLAGGALGYGMLTWRAAADEALVRLARAGTGPAVARYSERELSGLPAPVERYFRNVLVDGQPVITGVKISQEGEFRTGDGDERWRPFTAEEHFTARPPGFVWLARIQMAPGLGVDVRDSYLGGAGAMRAAMLGLFTMADAHDTPEMATGALQRWLAEAPWFPTALLPSQGVRWTAIDDSTARATITDGQTTVSVDFSFDSRGEITQAFTAARYRALKGTYEVSPWGGTFRTYAAQGGVRVPTEAEVAWILGGQRVPYWRGRNTRVVFDHAR